MGRFRNAWRSLTGRAPVPQRPTQPEQYKATLVLQEADGWYPAVSFSGGDLSTLLTQALWVWICATRIADDVASMPAVVQTRPAGTNKWKSDYGHPLNKLIRRPFGKGPDRPPWDWPQMMQAASIRLDFDGNAFLRKHVLLDRLIALQLLQQPVTAIEDQARVAQLYQVVGLNEYIPPDKMVNVMLYGAGSYWNSPATIEAVGDAATIDQTIQSRVKYDLEHRIAPGVVLKVKAYFNMSDEQRTKTETLLEESFEGAMNAGKSLIVGDNVDVQEPPVRQVDDLPAHAEGARDNVISGFHIAPPCVGVLKEARYANYSEALRAQWTFCIRPRMSTIYNPINTQGVEPVYGPDVRIWYELAENELGLEVLEMRAEAAKKLVDIGHPPGNASERVGLGMTRFEGDDRPMMPALVAGRDDPNRGVSGEGDDGPT